MLQVRDTFKNVEFDATKSLSPKKSNLNNPRKSEVKKPLLASEQDFSDS
jgi:hypothetical protein